jgi:hypothetical protein
MNDVNNNSEWVDIFFGVALFTAYQLLTHWWNNKKGNR